MPAPAMADGEVGAAAVAVEHDAQRQQRVRDAALDHDERGEQDGAGGEQADASAGRLQPWVSALREAVDEGEQARRRR